MDKLDAGAGYVIATVAAALAALAAMSQFTQAAEKAIVVFDASGSMWGQIQGKSKIEIARDVLKKSLPAWKDQEMELGLIAYGHRQKGECKDIQTLIPSGPINVKKFNSTINGIRPKGKTPLTAAVRTAAEELKFTEQKATVILLSDGLETCNLDPCAVASELEQNGVDFTAHVIGFDIAKPEEKKQLACIAENTGGVFVTASNAKELSDAFTKVAALKPASFVAVNAATGAPMTKPVDWRVTGGDVNIETRSPGAQLTVPDIPTGTYQVEAVSRPFKGGGSFEIGDARGSSIEVALNADLPKATISAPDSVAAVSEFEVTWEGPGAPGDKIQLSLPGAVPGTGFIQSIDTAAGKTLQMKAPPDPGPFELRYYSEPFGLLAQVPLTVGEPAPGAFLQALDKVKAGETFDVQWTGPGHERDWVDIAESGANNDTYLSYVYTRTGNPVTLRAPSAPGTYEIRYVNGSESKVMGKKTLTVTDAGIVLASLDEVKAGESFDVQWTGPGHERDWVDIANPGAKSDGYLSYLYVRTGNPVKLRAPSAPGTYEIRYINGSESKVMGKKTLTVTDAGIVLASLDEVKAGESFDVQWTGPGHERDWVDISNPGAKSDGYLSYLYVRTGNPVKLRAPSAPGKYEIRYVNGSDNQVMGTRPLTVNVSDVALSAPSEVKAGASLDVQWTGPGHERDWVDIANPGAKSDGYTSYVYVRTGNPVKLRAPSTPGTYDIRYVNGSESMVMGKRSLTVVSPPQPK